MGGAGRDEHEGWLGDLFRRHHQSLVGFVGRATRAAGSAEDVAQEAYLRLAGRDGAALAIEHPKTYLFATSRSEEHTSELQSLMRISYAVLCLKKKTKQTEAQQ